MRLAHLSFHPAKPTAILAACAIVGILVLTALAFTTDRFIDSRQTRLVDRLLANYADGPEALVERLRLAQKQFIQLVPPGMDRLHQSFGMMSFDLKTFPETFLKGLVYDVVDGCPIYTVTVQENPKTREIHLYNGDDVCIYTLAPAKDYDSRWLVSLLKPETYDAKYTADYRSRVESWLDPAHVEIVLKLLPVDYIDVYAENTIASLMDALESMAQAAPDGDMMLMRSPLATNNIVFDAISSVSTGIELQISYPDNFTNRLEIYSSSNLLHTIWFLLQTNLLTAGTNTLTWVDVSATNMAVSNRFYAAGDAGTDSDLDGLADAREYFLYNTAATNRDSDSDGLVDGFSGIVVTNIYPGGAHTNGGAYVEGELTWHTLPTVTDTDDDGMGDGWEVSNGHNPTNWNDPPNVRGTVSYAGRQTGTVWVLAVTTSNSWATNVSYSASSSASPFPQIAYRIPHLEQTNYWLNAWLDSNASGTTNATEARGAHTNSALVITNRVTDRDITLADPDVDSDNVPDWWEIRYFGSTTNWTGAEHADNDAYTNFEEYQADTDPTNTASHPWDISGTVTYSGPQTGVIHVIACIASNSWVPAQTTTNAAPGAYTITHLPPGTTNWVRAWRDSNGDGSNTFGEAWGQFTNSVYLGPNATGIDITLTDPDTDGDTLPDWWEVRYGLDPLHGGSAAAAAWWKLDENSGTNVLDSTINANHGTLYNASNAWASGIMSNAVSLDGTNDYVQFQDSASLNPNLVSVSLWIKPTLAYTNGSAVFFSKKQPTGAAGYVLSYEQGSLSFLVCSTGAKTVSKPYALTNGVWHHVVGTYSGDTHSLYVDGVLQVSTNYTLGQSSFGYIDPATTAPRIAASTDSIPTNYFAGVIDDARIYDRGLASNEVHAVYEVGFDADGDGLSNLEEYRHGADPGNPDTDGDGLSDFAEVFAYGTNPAKRDTDDDGMDDDEELLAGTNPTVWNAGASATSIRYYYDSDDRVTGAYGGADGGGGSGTYVSTPAGNISVTAERRTP